MAPTRPASHPSATGRPVIKNNRRTGPPKHQRDFTTYAKKLYILNHLQQHTMDCTLDTFFKGCQGVARRTAWKKILHWRKQRAHITKAATSAKTAKHRTTRAVGTATTLGHAAEENLANWIRQLRSDGIPVSRELLACKALEVAKDLQIEQNQFKASSSWVASFLRRWKYSTRAKTRSGQDNLAEGEKTLNAFSLHVKTVIEKYQIEDVFNADQTGINYEYLPKETIDAKGSKTVWVKCAGHEKDRITAMLLADIRGNKYPLFLVLKSPESKIKEVVQENLTARNGFGTRVWKEIEELHERHPSRIYGNPTAWWNGDISLAFLKYHFGHRRGKNLKHVLLLWDDFSAHFTEAVKAYAEEVNVVLERIPPTFTWICQPADVAWMKPLKAHMRRQWVNHLRSEIDKTANVDGTFKLRAPTRFELVEWVNDAWDNIPRQLIVSGFSKCKIIPGESAGDNHDGQDSFDDVHSIVESLLQLGVANVQLLNGDDEVETDLLLDA
ncbi:hypothetical protein DYB32_010930 [Aphanomyces invadans]|uniref:HTH CENPB-type domain-containing protein n=1 Tax=Aphanomyces invadans TaxID=157072 RepID=A0A3R6WDA5_9STRA|nr:hypothetical protein DYB32_010930 [Aphanomyces invadans]